MSGEKLTRAQREALEILEPALVEAGELSELTERVANDVCPVHIERPLEQIRQRMASIVRRINAALPDCECCARGCDCGCICACDRHRHTCTCDGNCSEPRP